MTSPLDLAKQQTRAWFEALRDRICAAFEAIEADYGGKQHAELPPGKFERKSWQRPRDPEGPNAGQDRGDRKSTRLNSSHTDISRMPSSA